MAQRFEASLKIVTVTWSPGLTVVDIGLARLGRISQNAPSGWPGV